MIIELFWSLLGLGYMAGRGIKERANKLESDTHSTHSRNLIETYRARWTDRELEARLRIELRTRTEIPKILRRIEEYKEERGELSIIFATQWENIGIVAPVMLPDKKGVFTPSENIIELAMHTYGKLTSGQFSSVVLLDIEIPKVTDEELRFKHNFLQMNEASFKKQEALRNLDMPFNRKLQVRLSLDIQRATFDYIMKRFEKFDAIWNRIEAHKRDEGYIPDDQSDIWKPVGFERLPMCVSDSGKVDGYKYKTSEDRAVEEENRNTTLRLLMTTYGNQTIRDALLKVYSYTDIPKKLEHYFISNII
jgi:hypothetical protein